MSGSKKIIKSLVLASVIILTACGTNKITGKGLSPVKVEPYLEPGDYINDLSFGYNVKGKYLKFKLTNTSNEDYLVQFDLKTKGITKDSKGSREYVRIIPTIMVPAYAKTENKFGVNYYNSSKNYYVNDKLQFYGFNDDGTCLAESVQVMNLVIIKASTKPELTKPYRDNEGRLVYEKQGAIPDGGSYSQKLLK